LILVNKNQPEQVRLLRALLALVAVLTFGTCGFMIIQEDWGFWRSLYFTVITITTVGYGDYGLCEAGERFTAILLIFGIGTATYAFGEVVKSAIAYQSAWSFRMQRKVDRINDHFVICGFGRVGKTVCERLTEQSVPFVVIENDDDAIKACLARDYLCVRGEASADATLLEAGIQRARGCVCAVDSDSLNIVITLGARELNPDILIVSRADAEDAVHKIHRAGASHVVSPLLRGGDDIANRLTRPHLTEFIDQSRDEASGYKLGEVKVAPASTLVGKTLKDYGRSHSSIAFLAIKQADGQTRIRPKADEAFAAGDIVFVVGDSDGVYQMSRDAAPV